MYGSPYVHAPVCVEDENENAVDVQFVHSCMYGADGGLSRPAFIPLLRMYMDGRSDAWNAWNVC